MLLVADNTLGKLRRWMALLGYNIVCDARSARDILAHHAHYPKDSHVIGRCPGLALELRTGATHESPTMRFVHLESAVLEEQLREMARLFPLDYPNTLFSRCAHCNVALAGPMPYEELKPGPNGTPDVPLRVREWRKEFRQCPKCGRVYWEGTHTARIRKYLRDEVGLPVGDDPPE